MKMPTIVGIFIFISREIFLHSYVQQQFAIVSKLRFITGQISCSAELSMNKNFITSVRRASREEEIEEDDGNRDKQCSNRILITSKFINLLKILQNGLFRVNHQWGEYNNLLSLNMTQIIRLVTLIHYIYILFDSPPVCNSNYIKLV